MEKTIEKERERKKARKEKGERDRDTELEPYPPMKLPRVTGTKFLERNWSEQSSVLCVYKGPHSSLYEQHTSTNVVMSGPAGMVQTSRKYTHTTCQKVVSAPSSKPCSSSLVIVVVVL